MQKVLTGSCFLLIFLSLFLSSFRPITAINEDLGRHLLLGKIILQTHTVPTTNLLSYTYPDHPFINSHWLSEVIFSLVHNVSGFNGLLLLSSVTILLTYIIFAFFFLKRYPRSAFLLSSCVSLLLIMARTDIRPELFSYLLLALFLTLLFAYREHPTKTILLLIPLQILWVNIHIYFFIGILLLLFFFIDQLIYHQYKITKSIKLLGITFILATLGTVLNPNGIHGALFPLTVPHSYGIPVAENQNIIITTTLFPQPASILLLVAIATLFLLLFYHSRKTTSIDWFLAIFFSLAALAIFRNITLFAYATLIPFTKLISYTLPVLKTLLKKYVSKHYLAILKVYSLSILLLVLLGLAAHTIAEKDFGFGVETRGEKAVDFLLNNHLQSPLFNDFNIGGYLAYRIYPQKVFIDNRPEAYPKMFFEQTYLPLEKNAHQFIQVDNKYHFNTIILSHWDQTPSKNRLLTTLLQNTHYTLVYLDDYALILIRNTKANKHFVQKYRINEATFSLPQNSDERALLRYLYFFEKVGWHTKEKQAYEQLLKHDPQACILKKHLASIKNSSVSLTLDQANHCP